LIPEVKVKELLPPTKVEHLTEEEKEILTVNAHHRKL